MTQDDFRNLALSFPEVIESSHMGHPDFRVGGKIFATIAPGDAKGMAKLTPEQQAWFLGEAQGAFEPAAGTWGERGATMILFAEADEELARRALNAAWRNTAPKKLIASTDDPE